MAAYQHANRLPCPTHASPLQWHPRTPPHCLARVRAPHCTPAHNTRTHREHRNYTRGQGVYGAQTAHACGLHGSARIYGPGCRVWAQVRAMCSPGPVGASLSRCPLLLLSRARRVNLPAHRTFLPLCMNTLVPHQTTLVPACSLSAKCRRARLRKEPACGQCYGARARVCT